ncbi:response regulator [Spongiactinospora gelatinilytica]|uniref:response regulator n=1 Tax=Spongiactinospora gelatinilytica TaxID=2666298 RepID=UPI002277DAB9|nr:response regulator transcription factor [Spongiactinospora gelatinilytica]
MLPNGRPYRVLIAADQHLLRVGFRMLIDSAPDMETVGEAGTGRETVELARRLRPDIVLMDIRMSDVDGLEATRPIRATAATAAVKVLILTTFDLDEYVYAALRAGAGGFLLKDTRPDALLDALRVVAAGEALLAPTVTRRLIAHFARHAPHDPGVPKTDLTGVTGREHDVLVLIARGLANPEIAIRLGINLATVKTHIRHLMAKLGVRDRAQLVIAAYENGVVRAGEVRPRA